MYTRINPHQKHDDLLRRTAPPNSELSRTPGIEPAEIANQAITTWKGRLADAEALVASRPGLSLMLAAGLGCAIGWWMKRK